jgi:hypothetical protein
LISLVYFFFLSFFLSLCLSECLNKSEFLFFGKNKKLKKITREENILLLRIDTKEPSIFSFDLVVFILCFFYRKRQHITTTQPSFLPSF